MNTNIKNVFAYSSKRALQFGLGIAIVASGAVFAVSSTIINGVTVPGTVTTGETITKVWADNINEGMTALANKTTAYDAAAAAFDNNFSLLGEETLLLKNLRGAGKEIDGLSKLTATEVYTEKLFANGSSTFYPNPILARVNNAVPKESERLMVFKFPGNHDGVANVSPWYTYLARAEYGGMLAFKPRNIDGTYKNAGVQFLVDGSIKAKAFTQSSDERLKSEISTINGLDVISKLRGVSFEWKDNGKKDMGVIAQEIEVHFPELVSTDLKTGLKSVSYTSLIGPLIEATKTQQETIVTQQAQIDSLVERITALEQE